MKNHDSPMIPLGDILRKTHEATDAWVKEQNAQMKTQHTPGPWRIESRWPAWSKWRIVTPKPHSEKLPFDDKGLLFMKLSDAEQALGCLKSANEGEFRIVSDDSTAVHTSGPWSVSAPQRRDWGGSGEWYECRIFAGSGAQHGNALAIVNLGGVGATNTGKAEVMANARLIAAAPDLLEACKSMLEWMEFTIPRLNRSNTERMNWGGPIHRAEAAIAKATGGE